jgi:hypothetical protein
MSTGDPEIHGGRLSAAPCRGWPECPRCNARRTQFCAAPPPAADAVTDAMVDRALDAWWGCTPPSAGYAPDERDDMRLAIAAALAARSEK